MVAAAAMVVMAMAVPVAMLAVVAMIVPLAMVVVAMPMIVARVVVVLVWLGHAAYVSPRAGAINAGVRPTRASARRVAAERRDDQSASRTWATASSASGGT